MPSTTKGQRLTTPQSDDIRGLVLALAITGRPASLSELRRIREHVATVGFDPTGQTRLGQRAAGVIWQGQRLAGNATISTELAHFLRHVVGGQEWPSGTSFGAYVVSLQAAIADPEGRILLDRLHGFWRLTFFAASGRHRGPFGGDWIVVGYSVDYGYWTTGFQTAEVPDDYRQLIGSEEQRWLGEPR